MSDSLSFHLESESQSVGRACVILRFRLNNETTVNSDSFMFAAVAIMWVWPQVSVYFYWVLKKNTFCSCTDHVRHPVCSWPHDVYFIFPCRWRTHKWHNCALVPDSVRRGLSGPGEACGAGLETRGKCYPWLNAPAKKLLLYHIFKINLSISFLI